MFVTEKDLGNLYRSVLIRAAQAVRYQDYDFAGEQELGEFIQAADNDLYETMQRFLESYRQWWEFCKDLEDRHTNAMASGTTAELSRLMDGRNRSREELKAALQQRNQR